MPPTNCPQANQSAGNGPLDTTGAEPGECCGRHHYCRQQNCSTLVLTRVSAPPSPRIVQIVATRLARLASECIEARLAPTGSTPNELTMCKGGQVYDYICIDCECPESHSLSVLLVLLLLLSLLLLLLLLLPLFLLLPLSLGCCLLGVPGPLVLLLLLLLLLAKLYAGKLDLAAPDATALRDAHLEAPPIISNTEHIARDLSSPGPDEASGNRIIPVSSTLKTPRIYQDFGHQHHDSNIKYKRHKLKPANLHGDVHLAHYGPRSAARLCHYSLCFGRPTVGSGAQVPAILGVSERPSQPHPSLVSSSTCSVHLSAYQKWPLCVLLCLLLSNLGHPYTGKRPELARGQPSIMLASASATVERHRFTTAPREADNMRTLDGTHVQSFEQRFGHPNDRPPTSGGQPRQQHQRQPLGARQQHSSHGRLLNRDGTTLIGGSHGSSQAGNLLLLPWGLSSGSGPQHLESGACAPGCVCLWKNGKQAADCSQRSQLHNQLNHLPIGLDPLTQVLNLTGQPLGELAAGAFASIQLTNLQRIHLAKCQLSLIHLQAFERLKLLVELELSWNQLKAVPVPPQTNSGSPSQMQLLRRLLMRGNPLGALDEHTLLPADDPRRSQENSSKRLPVERLLETYPELGPMLASSSELALTRLAGSGAGQVDAAGRDQLWLQLEVALEAAGRAHTDLQDLMLDQVELDKEAPAKTLLASHFPQLQELDFGQCQLAYIKWNVFAHLNQLKRLLLDGNQLSQLSGRLVRLLPVNLHQLALEGNPLVCDCRALALARWLARSRTPLSSPVRCHQQQQQHQQPHLKPSVGGMERTGKSLGASSGEGLLDDLVCAPQPLEPLRVATSNEFSPPPLHLLIHYLWPTLIRNSQELNSSLVEAASQPASPTHKPEDTHPNTMMLHVREGDKITLRCPLLAYPEWSIHYVWVVEYGSKASDANQSQNQPLSAGHLPVEERLLVLYDSRLRSKSSQVTGNSSQLVVNEQPAHGARFLVRQVRLQLESAFVESEMIIESVLTADSGRYKCMGLNKAGNVSHEFMVRIWPQSHSSGELENSPQPPQEQHQSPNLTIASSHSTGATSGKANKGSTTMQVTMVLVSALMGAVIVAFILFCVLIYQIKPSSTPGSLEGRRLEESLPEVVSRQPSPGASLRALVPTTVHCDPRTGQSVAVHAASPASSLATLTLVGPLHNSVHTLAPLAQQPLVAHLNGSQWYQPIPAHQKPAQIHSMAPTLDTLNHHLLPKQPIIADAWQPVALL